MPDDPVAKYCPVLARDKFYQVLFDFLRRFGGSNFEAITQARYVRIHHHAFVDVESVAKDHIGGLAAHAGEGDQLGHRPRHFSVVLLHQCAAGVLDVLGLVAKEADTPDAILQLLQGHSGKVRRLLELLEQILGDDVYLFVGALRGKDRGHHKL